MGKNPVIKPNVIYKKMTLVTWGCGNRLETTKFKGIKNGLGNKPKDGGLWTSPYQSENSWRKWGKANKYGNFNSRIKMRFEGWLFVVDEERDLAYLPREKWYLRNNSSYPYLNCVSLVDSCVDGIWLTARGQRETHGYYFRRDYDWNLYGWDCETVLLFNLDCVKQV